MHPVSDDLVAPPQAAATRCPVTRWRRWLDYMLWTFMPGRILGRWQTEPLLDIPSWSSVYFVGDPQIVKEINKATGKIFLGGQGNEFLKPLLGPQSVFLVEGETHRLARTLISRAVSYDTIKNRQPEIRMLMNAFVADAMSRRRTELTRTMRWLAFQLVCRFAFGSTDLHMLRRLFECFERATGVTGNLVVYNRAFWTPRGRYSVGHLVEKIARDVDIEIHRLIANARVDKVTGAPNLLSLLLGEQSQYGYDDGFVRDNLVSVLAAGYDTTGSALAWQCYWLAQQPCSVLQGLRAETELAAPAERPRLTAFINESLRLCSPIEILPRKIAADGLAEASRILGDELAAEMHRHGSLVSPCPFAVHHNPAVYDDPEQFDASRFLGRSYKMHEFLPFGGGSRFCVGHTLGRTILETFLVALLSQGKTLRLTRPLRFRPIRRGVSLWPAYRLVARLVPIVPPTRAIP